jgi:hypothetical protein
VWYREGSGATPRGRVGKDGERLVGRRGLGSRPASERLGGCREECLELVARPSDVLGRSALIEAETAKKLALARFDGSGDQTAAAHRQETTAAGLGRTRRCW